MRRHSSRRTRLDHTVLNERLAGAVSYDRIAGYFRSSLFEVAGEAISQVRGPVRIICNSELDPEDIVTAAAAQAAMRRSWCSGHPEDAPPNAMPRYKALFEALTSRKIEVRVLPDSAFGLIHGKAGVIRRADGSATAFLGSVNESAAAWKLNYELLWEDESPETVDWVQEEFNALWNDPRAMDLACCPFIVQDIERIVSRRVIEPKEFQETDDPTRAAAAAAVETPVYRREQGLWPHQKYFARLALERHRLGGARLVLADQVGLGKTVQLAMAAMLMALDDPDSGPILVLAPKPLLQQWQDEMMELLKLPSARWSGRAWIDEHDLEYPSEGASSLGKCPRRIGLVSQGLVVRGMRETLDQLLGRHYACVIVDEAHRARRREIPKVDAGDDEVDERGDPNKLMEFLREIGGRTKSMLLATATPVQLHPVEAWDLLHILSHGNDGVLGGWTRTSPWFQPSRCLAIATGQQLVPTEPSDGWQFVRDPLPARSEDPAFDRIRRNLDADDQQWQFRPEVLDKLSPAIRRVQLENSVLPGYGEKFNPLLRCIVRRTRGYLEEMAKLPEFAGMEIGLYAGSHRSGIWRNGRFQRCERELLKARVRAGELKLLLGTDAASEGLNLQRLGTLINIDLPWNPTRLEQRKGRIQRIGQVRSEVWIANLRYRGSVEDRVHEVLADRLEAIHGLFGQIPDTLEDVWVQIALHNEEQARQLIDRTTATRNPFDAKYSKVEDADWETCSLVIDPMAVRELLSRGW